MALLQVLMRICSMVSMVLITSPRLQPSPQPTLAISRYCPKSNIDGRGFTNTGSNSGVNADTINSNGISYYTAGVTNFSGNATDGALYSQYYRRNWQHQIAGDYRSGQ